MTEMLTTSLEGRLRNTRLPPANSMGPVYETIVNSIQAVDNLPGRNGTIELRIIREPAPTLPLRPRRGALPLENITDFEVVDNGVGFTDPNMESFRTLDSLHKAALGGRGVGRLLWLKAFERARISSCFDAGNGSMMQRQFEWNPNDGVVESPAIPASRLVRTCVHLEGFKSVYRLAAPKTASAIANGLLEHCLFYFVRPGGAPRITVVDGTEIIEMLHLYEDYMVASSQIQTIDVSGKTFDITHIKLKTSAHQRPFIAWCASSRVVEEVGLSGKVPGLHGRISNEDGDFLYAGYVTSEYFDENVRPERIGFDIPSSKDELFAQLGPAMQDIETAVVNAAADYLSPYLENVKVAARDRINKYVSQKAVRYRPILKYLSEADLAVDPEISDKDLEVVLHQQWYDLERRLISEGQELLEFDDQTISEYQKRIADYLQKVDDIKKSDLANYVSHRKVVLKILERAIQRRGDGKYEREDLIHQLIVPMRKTSDDFENDECNLWLIDERLAFHNFLASDKPLSSMPIVSCNDPTRPDICVLDVMDEPLLVSDKPVPATLTIVEIKRPMRSDVKEEDPIDQTYDYLKRIRAGNVTTAKGRPIPGGADIPGFCYVICDLNKEMVQCCEKHDFTRTSDGLGYFGYHKGYKTYVEVRSFDAVIRSANERNSAFFSRLGLPVD